MDAYFGEIYYFATETTLKAVRETTRGPCRRLLNESSCQEFILVVRA